MHSDDMEVIMYKILTYLYSAQKAGREPQEILLVAVEKNIMTAHRNGKRSYYDSIRKNEDRTALKLSFFN